MIPVGSKIEVIASSTKGKGTKVRKGSLGYISTVGKVYCIGTKKSATGAMFIVPAKIVFTQFGYETKERNEVKFVSLVYPSTDPKEIKNKRAYLNKLTKLALDHAEEVKQIFKTEGITVKKIPAIAVHTLNGTENVTRRKVDYSAWFRSIALSGILHEILYCNPNDPKLKTMNKLIVNDVNLLEKLRAGTNSRNDATALVDNLFIKGKKEVNAFAVRMQEVLQLDKLHKLHEIRINRSLPGRSRGTTFGMCWQLYAFNMTKRAEDIARSTYSGKHCSKLALSWLNIYSEMIKKSI